jgi:hypothetical protein
MLWEIAFCFENGALGHHMLWEVAFCFENDALRHHIPNVTQ